MHWVEGLKDQPESTLSGLFNVTVGVLGLGGWIFRLKPLLKGEAF